MHGNVDEKIKRTDVKVWRSGTTPGSFKRIHIPHPPFPLQYFPICFQNLALGVEVSNTVFSSSDDKLVWGEPALRMFTFGWAQLLCCSFTAGADGV